MSRNGTHAPSPSPVARSRFALPTPVVSAGLCALAAAALAAPAHADAEYSVVFNSMWSAETHPIDFPGNPHFSGLIGGTHHDGAVFWEPGALASDGIESMAETGSKTLLMQEVESAISGGAAEHVLSGGGISPSPGDVSLTFTITETYPLVTLVSMIAPSPDWFVGVHDLDLYEGGMWADEVVVDLYVYDAGTDSGETYESPNDDTDPADPIMLLQTGPFVESGYVGTFTFTRITVDVEPGSSGPAIVRLAPIHPNPSPGVANVAFELPHASPVTLDVFDVGGRRVRRLADGVFDAGRQLVSWDGALAQGEVAPAGVYLVRLVAGGTATTRRVVLMR